VYKHPLGLCGLKLTYLNPSGNSVGESLSYVPLKVPIRITVRRVPSLSAHAIKVFPTEVSNDFSSYLCLALFPAVPSSAGKSPHSSRVAES